MTRIPLKGGDEYDAFSKHGRKALCYLNKPGICKAIKRKYNRRFRRLARVISQG